MRRFVLLICIIVFPGLLFSQEGKQYNFRHYTIEMGLSSYQTNSVVQDDDGFIWIASTNGLQRYDGIRFKTFAYSETNPHKFPSNPVWQVLFDRNKNLWLLFADGRTGIFNRVTFRFEEAKTIFKNPVSPSTFVKKLITDEEGHIIYLSAGHEIITWDKKSNQFSADNNFFTLKKEWLLSDFIQQPGTKKYWMGLAGGGLAVYNKQTGNLSYPGHNTEHEKLVDQFDSTKLYYGFLFDSKQRFWAIHWQGISIVSCYNLNQSSFLLKDINFGSTVSSYHEVNGFFQQKDGTVWARGLLVLTSFNEKTQQFEFVSNAYTSEKSIVYEVVHFLYEDREENIWVATDNNGLYSFAPQKELFININHINRVTGKKGNGSPMSFIQTNRGNLLVGTWDDGVYQYDKDFNVIPVDIKGIDNKGGPYIWNMARSKDSNLLWLAAQPGFMLVNQKNNSSTYYNPAVMQNKTVRQIAEDKNGNIWLGTQSNGLFKYARTKKEATINSAVYAIDGIPHNNINKITIGPDGNVWVGTPEDGLYVINPDNDKIIQHFGINEKNEFNLPERGISSILNYSDSLLIITTATRILKYNIRDKKLTVLGGAGIISGFITAVEKDKEGFVWITTSAALYRMTMPKTIFLKFGREDGLENEHFTQSASYVMRDGRIIFGTTNNMVIFNPAKLKSIISGPEPTVKITELLLENKSIDIDSLTENTLNLSYKSNAISIEFSPLIYNKAYLVKYKMTGLDNKWNNADINSTAVYNYLPPGTYQFTVKVINEEGKESPEEILLLIEVANPFWRTWWFYILILLSIGSLLFWIDRERIKRKEAHFKMRADIADDLHKDINSALNNINILSEMAKLKADAEPLKSKEFIEQISTRSHSMMIVMDDLLWNIDPANDNMEKVILRLKEYIDAMRNRNGVQIDLLVEKPAAHLPLNMKLRKEIFWLYRSGLTNVIKTGGDNCRICICYEKQQLVYILEFDTAKMDLQQMNNLRQRQELTDKLKSINATLEMQVLQHSAAFILKIPVS